MGNVEPSLRRPVTSRPMPMILLLAGVSILADIAVVLALVGLGHEHLDILPDQLGSGVSEQRFGRGIDALNDARLHQSR